MKCFILKNKPQTSVSLYQIGYEKCNSYHSFGPVERDFYLLHFVVSGKGTLEIENQSYSLKKGDLFLLPLNKVIRYRADASDPYEYYWIGFSSLFNEEILHNIGFNNNYVINVDDKYEELLKIFEQINDITKETSVKDNMKALSIFYNIMSLITPKDFEYQISDERKELIYKLSDYIENTESKVTIEQLEKLANMHRSNIYRLFIKTFKMSPSEYITKKHLEKSLYLLKNTNASIKEISIKCGFNSVAYFCKMFKDNYGKSPGEARKLK